MQTSSFDLYQVYHTALRYFDIMPAPNPYSVFQIQLQSNRTRRIMPSYRVYSLLNKYLTFHPAQALGVEVHSKYYASATRPILCAEICAV
jgi:hypothetical protein